MNLYILFILYRSASVSIYPAESMLMNNILADQRWQSQPRMYLCEHMLNISVYRVLMCTSAGLQLNLKVKAFWTDLSTLFFSGIDLMVVFVQQQTITVRRIYFCEHWIGSSL